MLAFTEVDPLLNLTRMLILAARKKLLKAEQQGLFHFQNTEVFPHVDPHSPQCCR